MNHDDWSDAQNVTTVTVDDGDLAVAYYEAGRDRAGPPVVFLHGIPTWSFLWREIAPPLAEDRHVVAPDLLGYGNSAMGEGFDRSVRAQETMLDALRSDLDLGDRLTLVAHDVGGGAALRYAAGTPDRVDRLVLSNCVAYDSWPVEFVNSLGVPGAVTGMDDEELDAKLDFAFAEGLYGEENETFVAGMKSPWTSPGGQRALERAAVATNTNDTTGIDYGAITADTLCLWGADDVLQPYEYAKRLAEDVPNVDLEPLDRAYHWVTEDRTEAYRDRLRAFLTD